MTIPEFAGLFSGRLAEYGACFVLQADQAGAVAGTVLADAEFLSTQLSHFAETHYPGADRRAVASLWSKAHFATLLPPFMAVTLVLQRSLDISLDAIGCTFWPDGTLRHIHLPDAGRIGPVVQTEARFQRLTEGHLAPLIGALSRVGGVSKRVLWSNAGNVFDLAARRAEAIIGINAAIADVLALMQKRRLTDRRLNPLYEPVRYDGASSAIGRRRNVCCVRYLIERLDYCSSCPHLNTSKPLSASPGTAQSIE